MGVGREGAGPLGGGRLLKVGMWRLGSRARPRGATGGGAPGVAGEAVAKIGLTVGAEEL